MIKKIIKINKNKINELLKNRKSDMTLKLALSR